MKPSIANSRALASRKQGLASRGAILAGNVPGRSGLTLCLRESHAAAEIAQRLENLLAVEFGLAFAESGYPEKLGDRAGAFAAHFVEGGVVHHDKGGYAVLLRGRAPPFAQDAREGRGSTSGRQTRLLRCASAGSRAAPAGRRPVDLRDSHSGSPLHVSHAAHDFHLGFSPKWTQIWWCRHLPGSTKRRDFVDSAARRAAVQPDR